ncbi:MAG: 5'-methylthioadenosine/adenosylhomocysteine nucleosidase [Chitinophagaceae bacterium]|nr:5'-methylthioadenosine/adenosylhomocysteine nucleosidase [Chitinophagaceae bacterium]
MRIGIMGAMPEEIDGLWQSMTNYRSEEQAGRVFHIGNLNGIELVIVFSRWGKVAAASTAATLLHRFGVSHIIFTGVAGALAPHLAQGDVVLAQRLIQYDMDARPMMPQFEIPLIGKTYFEPDPKLLQSAYKAFLEIQEDLQAFHPKQQIPQLMQGDIGSGDRFIGSHAAKENLLQQLPELLCIEMEGAAVAQVCYEHQIPFLVMRTISDAANDTAAHDFPHFVKHVAGPYATHWVKALLQKLSA